MLTQVNFLSDSTFFQILLVERRLWLSTGRCSYYKTADITYGLQTADIIYSLQI